VLGFQFIPLRSSGIIGTTAQEDCFSAVVPLIPRLRRGIN
jgi:hypothetical protein